MHYYFMRSSPIMLLLLLWLISCYSPLSFAVSIINSPSKYSCPTPFSKCQLKITIPHEKKINSANFSSDGKQMIIASNDTTVKITKYVNKKWQRPQIIIKEDEKIRMAKLSPQGNLIITISGNETVRIWKNSNEKWGVEHTIPCNANVRHVSINPDGVYIAITTDLTASILKRVNEKWEDTNTRVNHKMQINKARFTAIPVTFTKLQECQYLQRSMNLMISHCF